MHGFKRFLVSCLLTITALSGAASAAEPQLSVQLWSVKDDLTQDFKGTLESLADMGFDAVEFAGNFGPYADNPAGLKAYLADIGLEASGAHVGFDQLRNTRRLHLAVLAY